MSKQLINAYRNQLDKIIRFGGTKNETSVRRAFISLINSYAEKKNLLLVEEVGEDEFDYIYIVDTRSDVRANPKIAGTTHNVFGIQTGVAIMFLVKVENKFE